MNFKVIYPSLKPRLHLDHLGKNILIKPVRTQVQDALTRACVVCLPLSRAGTVHVLSVVVQPLTVSLRSPYWHPT